MDEKNKGQDTRPGVAQLSAELDAINAEFDASMREALVKTEAAVREQQRVIYRKVMRERVILMAGEFRMAVYETGMANLASAIVELNTSLSLVGYPQRCSLGRTSTQTADFCRTVQDRFANDDNFNQDGTWKGDA